MRQILWFCWVVMALASVPAYGEVRYPFVVGDHVYALRTTAKEGQLLQWTAVEQRRRIIPTTAKFMGGSSVALQILVSFAVAPSLASLSTENVWPGVQRSRYSVPEGERATSGDRRR